MEWGFINIHNVQAMVQILKDNVSQIEEVKEIYSQSDSEPE
jgi:hypothetical protein